MSVELKTISVRPSTKEKVKNMKRGGATYDDVISSLVNRYEAEDRV